VTEKSLNITSRSRIPLKGPGKGFKNTRRKMRGRGGVRSPGVLQGSIAVKVEKKSRKVSKKGRKETDFRTIQVGGGLTWGEQRRKETSKSTIIDETKRRSQ